MKCLAERCINYSKPLIIIVPNLIKPTLQTVGLHIMDPYVEWFIAQLF